jgi:tetratricopeptide (TPR) repeat protein
MVLLELVAAAGDNCIVVTGAGSDEANGVYVPTGRKWHDASVYENDSKCLLSREPHKSQKTGETSYGWILGHDRKPLYAVQSAEMTPPTAGWKKFNGILPLPALSGPFSYADGATRAAESLKEIGNTLFKACKYSQAETLWTRALSLAETGQAKSLTAALYSNRAEARLRLAKWDAALSDSQEALKIKPTHDKALLRAAVASRELKMYNEAYDFARKCLENNIKHTEARILLADLEYLIADVAAPDMAKAAFKKMDESVKKQEAGKKLGAKDTNMLSGVKAFEGYGSKREQLATKDERPPLSSLPYHHAGLPQDEVEKMDKFFQSQRDKKDAEKSAAKKEKENYAKIKDEYKAFAASQVQEGKLAGLDEIFGRPMNFQPNEAAGPLPTAPSLALDSESKTQPTEKVTLSAEDTSEIDALFQGLPTRSPAAAVVPAKKASDKKQKLEKARKAMLGQ